MKKAPLITFEGIDGAGKTTLLKALEEEVQRAGFSVISVREPGGTDLGEKMRSLLLQSALTIGKKAELALFLAARAQQIEEIILPSLEAGSLVFCDRFHDSSISYQGAARGLGEDFIEKLCSFFYDGFSPDLTIYLDISPEEAMKRTKALGKKQDRMEKEMLFFYETVRGSYQRLAKKYPKRIRTIDGKASKEEVHRSALSIVLDFLQKGSYV